MSEARIEAPGPGVAPADLTLVIPSYDTADRLEACLRSVEVAAEQSPELVLDVIVVDNGSQDDSVDRATRSSLGVTVVASRRNRGFASAVNRGLSRRRGRHALLLNSDVCVDPELLSRGLARLDRESSIAVVGAGLRHPNGRRQRSAHLIPDLWSELLPESLVALVRATGPRGEQEATTGHGGASALRDVEAVRGAVLFLRGDAIERLGPFDEGYFFFLEDTDYCARARDEGLRVVEDPELVAVHISGASSKRRAPLSTRIEFHRSLYRFLERRHGPPVARFARAFRTLRGLVAALAWSVPAPLSATARRRAAERWGLVLWHLRGCPSEPALARALLEDTRARRALDAGSDRARVAREAGAASGPGSRTGRSGPRRGKNR